MDIPQHIRLFLPFPSPLMPKRPPRKPVYPSCICLLQQFLRTAHSQEDGKGINSPVATKRKFI